MDDKGEILSDYTEEESSLLIDIDGFEGPLHLLLALAKKQKIDLTQISVLQLAQQYLMFIEQARQIELKLAADYYVMASWLAYLKSRLLLPHVKPEEEAEEEEGWEVRLAFRLKKLEAMRKAGHKLMQRAKWREDVFPSGQAQPLNQKTYIQTESDLYALLKAYGWVWSRQALKQVKLPERSVLALDQARRLIEENLSRKAQKDWLLWRDLIDILPVHQNLGNISKASLLASSFAVSLELIREERIDLQQSAPFKPLYIRLRL